MPINVIGKRSVRGVKVITRGLKDYLTRTRRAFGRNIIFQEIRASCLEVFVSARRGTIRRILIVLLVVSVSTISRIMSRFGVRLIKRNFRGSILRVKKGLPRCRFPFKLRQAPCLLRETKVRHNGNRRIFQFGRLLQVGRVPFKILILELFRTFTRRLIHFRPKGKMLLHRVKRRISRPLLCRLITYNHLNRCPIRCLAIVVHVLSDCDRGLFVF